MIAPTRKMPIHMRRLMTPSLRGRGGRTSCGKLPLHTRGPVMQENDMAHLAEHEIPSAAPKQLLGE